MKEQEYWLTADDYVEIYVKKWYTSNQKPQAIVQLSHGMAEHIHRYHDFARFLVENNIVVYGNDHRGHGNTGLSQGQLGYFADQNGFTKVAEDLFSITQMIKREYPDIPVFLFGHSMGSFLARQYIQKYSHEIHGLILSGTGFFHNTTTKTAKTLASLLKPKEKSPLMNRLAFGTYQKRIKHPQTSFDWLTNDEAAVQTYINDPLSGFIPTARFFYDLMTGLENIHCEKLNESIRKDLDMLIISGDEDPVGNYAEGIWKVANSYHQLDIQQIKVMIFEGGRHELLHEINKDDAFQAILEWLQNHC